MTKIDIRAIETSALKTKAFPNVEQGFRVVMAERALDRCVERGSADMTREIGGILVGEVLKDDSGPYVRVDDTVDALHADEKGAELTFTHETWEHINKEMDTKHEGKTIVGWYHTHPGFGVFLSDRDEFIHKSFFDQPFQVALVYDPKTREQGVFAWEEGSTARMGRYWIGRREHIWKRPEVATPTTTDSIKAASEPEEREAADYGRIDWGATAMVGLVLLILGGAGGWWMGAGSSGQAQAQLQGQLVEARLAGAQEAVKTLDLRVMSAVRAGFDTRATNEAIALIGAELRAAQSLLLWGEAPSPGQAQATVVEPVATLDPFGPGAASSNPGTASSNAGAASSNAEAASSNAEAAPLNAGPAPPNAGAVPSNAETSNGTQAEVIEHIKNARVALAALVSQRGGVNAALAQLERMGARARTSKLDHQALSVQRAALATLYADLSKDAKKQGDHKRAARYLEVAKQVNPKGGGRYDKQTGNPKGGKKGGKKKPGATKPGMKR